MLNQSAIKIFLLRLETKLINMKIPFSILKDIRKSIDIENYRNQSIEEMEKKIKAHYRHALKRLGYKDITI